MSKDVNGQEQMQVKEDPMVKVATFIVDKRNLFFLIFGIIFIFCAVASSWVSVENDISAYLPDDAETSIGLNLMDEQFVTYGTASVMVSNIDFEKAEEIADAIKEIPEVSMLQFDETSDHYNNFSALYSVTFGFSEKDDKCLEGLAKVEELVADYDYYVSTTLGDQTAEAINSEMQVVSLIVAVIVGVVLILTSSTYAEIPVLVFTFLASALMASGTNFFLGTISFVSDSVTIVLQLALSIDYAVIFCNRYKEEHEKLPVREADIMALSKAIPEIASSSLTTIGGLIAMMFMQFGLGKDMGICLIKAILLSLVAVFCFMPGLIMLFGNLMDKTKHKSFVPKIPFVGKFAYKTRIIMPPIFVAIIIVAFFFQNNCPYTYGYTLIETPKKNDAQIATEFIEESFGKSNMVAVMMPAGDYEKEAKFLDELESYDEVDYTMGLCNTEAMDGYMLTDKLTARQFSELLDLDYELAELVYTAYAVNDENYAKLVAGISTYSVPLIDMIFFVHDEVEEGYVTLEDDLKETLDDAVNQMDIAKTQLQGPDYSRALVYLTLPEEGDETFAFLDKIHEIGEKYWEEGVVVAGNSTSQYDLYKTFQRDNIVVSVLSILIVLVVLLFTFNSAGMPVLLIVVIQGAIWINFAYPTVAHKYLFFLAYLIVSSIQMGANIDYAIVISGRFLELKDKMSKLSAIIETMNFAFPTIITSGSILALAGIFIGQLTSDAAISGIGQCIGRGTIVSIIIVMFVLPQILLLGEKIIDKTSFTVSVPIAPTTTSGLVRVDGLIQGRVDGLMIGEFHGVIRGDSSLIVQLGSASEITAAEANEALGEYVADIKTVDVSEVVEENASSEEKLNDDAQEENAVEQVESESDKEVCDDEE